MQVHFAVLLLFDNDHSDLFKALFSSHCSWITTTSMSISSTAPRMYEREQQQKNGSVIYWKDVCCFVHCAVLRLTKSLNLKILILLKKRIWWFSWSGFIHNLHCSFFQTVPWMDVCCFYTSTQYIMSLSLLSRNIKTRLGNYKNTAEANYHDATGETQLDTANM